MKRLWPKILLSILAVVSILILVGYVIVSVRCKSLVISTLERLTSKDVLLSATEFRFPLRITIKDLKIKDLFEAREVKASLSVISLTFGEVIFSEVLLVEPKLRIELSRPMIDSSPFAVSEMSARETTELPQVNESVDTARKAGAGKLSRFAIKHFRIKRGEVNIIDRNVVPSGLHLFLDDLEVNIENLYFIPKSIITTFEINARMPWEGDGREGSIYFSGWVNFFKKDMQADLKIEGIDGVYLSPYYSNWVDVDAARIRQAHLNFTSDIRSDKNDLVAKCYLELTDIKFYPRPEGEELNKAEKITSAVLDVFRALDMGKVALNFTIKTTMDNPRFGIDAIRMAVDKKIAEGSRKTKPEDLLTLPVRFLSSTLKGTIKGTADVSRALVEGTIEVGRGMKESLEDAFGRKKPNAQPEDKDTKK